MTPTQKAKEIIDEYKIWEQNGTYNLREDITDQFLATPEAAAILSGEDWISVKDGLPESCKRVLILWVNRNGKHRTSLGFYATKFSVVDDNEDNRDGEYSEYNEETDQYYYPEGWVEIPSVVEYTADVSNVTHWMPLPEPPKP